MKILLTAGIDINQNNACSINFLRTANSFSYVSNDEIIVFTAEKKSTLFSILEKDTIIKKSGYFNKKLPNSINFLINIPKILNIIRKERIDIVYIRYNLMSFILVFFLRFFSNTFIVTEHHGWVEDELKSNKKNKFISFLFKKLQILDVKMAHLTRVVVEGIKEKFVNNGIRQEKIIVFQNGTDVAFFEDKKNFKKLKSDYFKIGFIGNLAAWQGVHIALMAMPIIFNYRKDIKLIIIGDGPEKKNLEQLTHSLNLKNNVDFCGEVSFENVPLMLSDIDIAIAPFTSERNKNIGLSPIKIRDYAASGLAIISSDIKGISDYDWLIKVQPDDPESLAKNILHLIENEPLRKSLQEKSKNYALEHFDVKIIGAAIMAEITKIKYKQLSGK
ncbi:MAG: glycosyltransferase family 4 protein [Alphaproteobacteria bacterium]|nr:glycosyltransferase family 4 protein [Alphaproteobacteria bacterium]